MFVISAYLDGDWLLKETVSANTRDEAVAQAREVLRARGFQATRVRFVAVRL